MGSVRRARHAGCHQRPASQRETGLWSPISSTLISAKRDALLVDAFITVKQAEALVDWVAASGKNLTTIYATHGHCDFFSAAALHALTSDSGNANGIMNFCLTE